MTTELLENDSNVIQVESPFREKGWQHTYVSGPQFEQNRIYFHVKYACDRVIGIGLLLVLWPLIGFLWILVKATSTGSGFYSQTRVGLKGKPFKVHKLRSMRCDAEKGTPIWSPKNDDRVTPVGKVLRKLHLDELPQLWNVAWGEMSMVGPRPERPEITKELEKYIPNYQRRHLVKPGITGLAQVNLEPDINVNLTRKKQVLDVRYINNSNLWLDLRLVFATCLRVLGFSGSKAMDIARLRQRIDAHELVEVGYEFDTPEENLWTPAKGLSKTTTCQSNQSGHEV